MNNKIIVFYHIETSCNYGNTLERNVEYCAVEHWLKKIVNLDFDMVILDCVTKADTCIDLLKNLKQIQPSIPIIIITNFAPGDFVIKAFNNGVRDFFKNPMNGKELRKAVDSILWFRHESVEKRNALLLTKPINDLEHLILPDDIPENIVRAIDYIERNIQNPLSLDEIAREAYMSKFHFCRIFKKCLGTSPLRYAINMRLNKAMFLLQRKDMNISTIAVECGFSDLSEFNKQFKKLYGSSPSSIRESIRTMK